MIRLIKFLIIAYHLCPAMKLREQIMLPFFLCLCVRACVSARVCVCVCFPQIVSDHILLGEI